MTRKSLKGQFDKSKIVEYPSFYTYNERKKAPLIITVEHAGNAWPTSEPLWDMPDSWQEQHYAYDRGAKELALKLSESLKCPAVLGKYSRVLVDLNRIVGAEDIVKNRNDGVDFPMNFKPDGEKRLVPTDLLDRRLNEFYIPYHRKIRELFNRLSGAKHLCIHSYVEKKLTEEAVSGHWHLGIQYPGMNPMAASALEHFNTLNGKAIGNNQPYNLRDGLPGAISLHAASFGIDTVELEFRDDQLLDKDSAKFWFDTTASWVRTYLEETSAPSTP